MNTQRYKKYLLSALFIAAILLYWLCLPFQLFDEPCSATLRASDGNLLGARISSAGQWYFPGADHVPEKFAECIICYEDERFRWHRGVDPVAVARAVVQNLRAGSVVSGASTLSMQVIRLSRPDAPRTIAEKLYEALLATRLEQRYSKGAILLMYASHAPFGGNVVGLEAAAWRYFGTDADNLSWAESATLAVLPNSPAMIHPGRNRERLLLKRNALLDKLCAKGRIDSLDCALAKDEPLPGRPLPMPDAAPHLLERLRARGGDRAYTSTIEYGLQRKVNDICSRYFAEYHANLIDNMGVLVADVRSGDVLAYYGNHRGSPRGSSVDMVIAPRSSGSTLKPFLYAAMLDAGEILPESLVRDTPYSRDGFAPNNFSRSYEGAVPADEVLARSLNVPSVRMLEKYGVDNFLTVLRGLGFGNTITGDADHYGLSLVLGGAEITLWDLAKAYYYLAASLDGARVNEDLRVDASEHPAGMGDLPLSDAAAYLAFNAVSEANRPEEESAWLGFVSSRRIAWKTGTSWGGRDAWSVGVTPDYVVAVWVGNADGEGRPQLTGVLNAAPVMFDVFSCLGGGAWFGRPAAGMTRTEVCSASGLPASTLCPERDTVWTVDVPQQPGVCPYHRLVHLSPDGLYQVNSNCCPVYDMKTEVRFVLPAGMEFYYRAKHLDYRPLPPLHPLFDAASDTESRLEIIYPQPGNVVIPARGFGGVAKGAVFSAAHSDLSASLYWYIDEDYVGETSGGEHSILVLPEPGRHVLTVVDSRGAKRSLRFESR